MSDLIQLTKDGDIAIITINNPPVNAISPGVPEGISEAIDQINKDSAVTAAVVIGGGRTFIAGADIKEFTKMTSGTQKTGPGLLPLLLKIENSSKPVVMAIHGTAFGGGLEVAMSGHYRVAAPNAQVGQPEVKLGLIPGAAGTQRLPRLAGVATAVEMCTGGNPVKASDALKVRYRGPVDRGRSAERRHRFRPRDRRQARSQNSRTQPETRNARTKRPNLRRRPRKRTQETTQPDRPAGCHRRHRSSHKTSIRGRLPGRGEAVHRLSLFRSVEGAHSRVLRRARGLQGPGYLKRDCDNSDKFRRGRRRRNHGRRYRHGIRQRRNPSAAQGSRSGRPRPRPRQHPQKLCCLSAARTLHPGRRRRALELDQAHT